MGESARTTDGSGDLAPSAPSATPISGRPSRGRHVWRLVVAVAAVVAFTAAGWFALGWLDAIGGPEALRARFGMRAAGVLVPLQTLISLTPFPPEPVAIGIAVIYGPVWGALLIWVGWMASALVQYGICRFAARDFDVARGMERLPAWLRGFRADHPVFLIAGRFVPLAGTHFVNSTAGALRVPLMRFVVCAAVGEGVAAAFIAGATAGVLFLAA